MAGDQVIFQDGIQLPRSPLSVASGGYAELLSKVFADPRGEFRRQPAENRVGFDKTDIRATPRPAGP